MTTPATGDTIILAERKLGGYAPEHYLNVRRVTVERTTATTFTADGIRFNVHGAPHQRAERVRWVDGFGWVWLEANTPDLCTAKVWNMLDHLADLVPAG